MNTLVCPECGAVVSTDMVTDQLGIRHHAWNLHRDWHRRLEERLEETQRQAARIEARLEAVMGDVDRLNYRAGQLEERTDEAMRQAEFGYERH